MSITSNLYAEKVFAEHPTGLWSLDETLDYVSLISEDQRDIQNEWTYSGAIVTEYVQNIEQPFPNSILNLIQFDNFSESSKEIKFVGPDIANFIDLDETIQTICPSSYFYTDGAYLQSVSIGFEYNDVSSGDTVEVLKTYNTSVSGKWVFISETFEYQVQNTTFRPVIKIKFLGGASSTDSYQVYINGLNIGQGSENFNTESLGISLNNFPSNINLSNITKCYEANAYGLGNKSGYYLANTNHLYCQNDSIPIVFGGSGVTKLMTNTNNPSFIIPGLGFLNESGRYNDYTVEIWMKINSQAKDPQKIFGPISSNDGLYVEDGFITMVIGDYFSSHFVGQWYRPMLIHIRLIKDSVSVLINGEEVIRMTIDTESLVLPSEYTGLKSNDWLGFYSYLNIEPFEIDSVSIYSYQIPISMAKRRWVFGQAVLSPEDINSAYNGQTAYIDYPFAGYTANYNYPAHGSWSQGTFDNMSISSMSLSYPNYELPEFYLDNKNLETLYLDCQEIQSPGDKYITFRPNASWDNLNTYLAFSKFNVLSDELHSLYVVFENNEYIESHDQILFEITDSINSFKAITSGQDIKYTFLYNGIVQELNSIENYELSTKNSVGVKLDTVSDYFGQNLLSFFGNKNNLKIYIGGNPSGLYPFEGKIYSVGLSSAYNANKLVDHFDSMGFVLTESSIELFDHTASYTLIPEIEYGVFYVDIGISGYWQDYIPLTYFASYIKDNDGNDFYDLDFLQYNLDYPSPSIVTETENPGTWSYDLLDTTYDHPVQRQYSQLDNFLFTGWANYEDLEQASSKEYWLDASGANVRSYVTLQYIANGANNTVQDYSIINKIPRDKVLDFSDYSNWLTTLFEVADNTIIYPPSDVDFNDLALVTHLEFNLRGIFSKPLAIKNLQVSSRALDHNTFNPIGTRFGINMYPYRQSGIYYDYKSKNPISIYKNSTPYLYTTRNSGIEIRGEFSPFINRGVSIPLNQNAISNYRVNAMQSWIRYDFDKFPFGPVQLLEIAYKGDTLKLFAVANSTLGNRAKIFAVSKNNSSVVNGLAFYVNGKLTREPVINCKEWFVLGISFSNSLNLDNQAGSINLNGPFVYNNITYYQATTLQQIQSKTYRPWLKVKNDGISDIFWEYWANNYIWDGVLVTALSNLYGVNPKDVYTSYIGTNKIIFDSTQEDITFTQSPIRVFTGVQWQSTVNTPV